jgi:hypothetical protein
MPTQRGRAIIYHYFDYRTARDLTPDLICGTFLKQLAQQLPALPPQVEELYELMKKRNRKPDKDALMPIILSLLKSFVSTYIVIDALDECFESYRAAVTDMIIQLRAAAANIFTTSRPHIEPIDEEGDEWARIEIMAHEEDIRHLFDHTLGQKGNIRKRLSAAFRDEIVRAIVAKAEGM